MESERQIHFYQRSLLKELLGKRFQMGGSRQRCCNKEQSDFHDHLARFFGWRRHSRQHEPHQHENQLEEDLIYKFEEKVRKEK